jgi:uncharacterized protein YcbK (DUF882 family)
MRSIVLGLAVTVAFAGTSSAQTNSARSITPEVVRGASSDSPTSKKPAAKRAAKAATVQKAAAASGPTVKRGQPSTTPTKRTTPQQLRGARYGGFAPAQPLPPPELDLTSPRSLSLINFNTQETLTVTYWSDGTYRREALDQLNHFLRDTRDNAQTEMDPKLFDVLWHTTRIVGYDGSIEVLSAYRSPSTNAWLASVSRGVARDSQHMNGNAMDVRFPGVPVFRIRQAAQSLDMGGVGFYPRSGFVHLDTGPVRYW